MVAESIKLMDRFKHLRQFLIKEALAAGDPNTQQALSQSVFKLPTEGEHDQDGELDTKMKQLDPGEKKDKNEIEDKLMLASMPEMAHDDPPSIKELGMVPRQTKLAKLQQMYKKASAYIKDVRVGDLPAKTQEDIQRFCPCAKDSKVAQYGMVVKELIHKADQNNYKSALANVTARGDIAKMSHDKFNELQKAKYILLMNDSIIDGHHMLAKAKLFGWHNSLNVLDLTPLRFQQTKKASLKWKRL